MNQQRSISLQFHVSKFIVNKEKCRITKLQNVREDAHKKHFHFSLYFHSVSSLSWPQVFVNISKPVSDSSRVVRGHIIPHDSWKLHSALFGSIFILLSIFYYDFLQICWSRNVFFIIMFLPFLTLFFLTLKYKYIYCISNIISDKVKVISVKCNLFGCFLYVIVEIFRQYVFTCKKKKLLGLGQTGKLSVVILIEGCWGALPLSLPLPKPTPANMRPSPNFLQSTTLQYGSSFLQVHAH